MVSCASGASARRHRRRRLERKYGWARKGTALSRLPPELLCLVANIATTEHEAAEEVARQAETPRRYNFTMVAAKSAEFWNSPVGHNIFRNSMEALRASFLDTDTQDIMHMYNDAMARMAPQSQQKTAAPVRERRSRASVYPSRTARYHPPRTNARLRALRILDQR